MKRIISTCLSRQSTETVYNCGPALGIKSFDGKTDHAICIVGNWIFDETFTNALKLCKSSLDLCSSSGKRITKFAGVTHGYMLKARNTAYSVLSVMDTILRLIYLIGI
jgi:hypothetical protein